MMSLDERRRKHVIPFCRLRMHIANFFLCLLTVLLIRTPLTKSENNDPNKIPYQEETAAEAAAAAAASPSSKTRIVVGKHVYEGPFDEDDDKNELYTYPRAVAKVLSKYNNLQRQLQQFHGNDYDQADWYLQLALAHQNVVEDELVLGVLSKSSSSSSSQENRVVSQQQNLELSLNAFQQAIQIYQGIKQKQQEQQQKNKDDEDDSTSETTTIRTDDPFWVVEHHLASAYCQMGETYSLSSTQQELSRDYLQQAHDMYRRILQDSTIDVASRQEIELSWAVCSLRLGVNLVNGIDGVVTAATNQQTTQVLEMDEESLLELEQLLLQQEQQLQTGGTVDPNALLQDWMAKHPEQAEKILAQQEQQTQKIEKAMEYFSNAIDILRRATRRMHQSKTLEWMRHLATGIQNLGAAQILNGDVSAAVKSFEEALSIEETEILPQLAPDSVEAQDTTIAIALALYSLSDNYLQLGRYDESNKFYAKAMDWYDRNRDFLEPPAGVVNIGLVGTQETLQAYETALEEYRDILKEQVVGVAEVEINGDEVYYEKNDGYEADLHLTLGSLYAAQADFLLAESHLIQAIQLYQMAGEGSENSIADAQFYLAIVRFHNKEYVESASLRKTALSVYQNTVGEGNNPMMHGMQQIDLGSLIQQMGPKKQEKAGAIPESTDPLQPRSNEKHQTATTTANVKADSFETVVDLLDYEEAMVNNSIKEEL